MAQALRADALSTRFRCLLPTALPVSYAHLYAMCPQIVWLASGLYFSTVAVKAEGNSAVGVASPVPLEPMALLAPKSAINSDKTPTTRAIAPESNFHRY